MELRVEHGLDAVVTKQHGPRQRDFRWSGWLGSAERLCKVRAWRNRFAPTTGPGPARYVLGMAVTYVFAGIPVAHHDAAAGYERLIGRPPDLVPNDDEAAWRLTETGWIYIVADADRAGSAPHTLLVDDLDAFLAGLAERGITIGPVATVGGAVRRTEVTDPDGNHLQVGQPPT